jgi:DNA-binding MarR family transcriptional regulator
MDNIGALLGDTSRMLRRAFDTRVRDIGVTRPQWQVLTVLRRHEGINQGGLAEQIDVEPITVCRMVDRLQEAGLVERRADPADRRSWRLFLTARAQDLLDLLRPIADRLFDEALEGISADEREQLSSMLERIRDNLGRRPGEELVVNG